MKTTVVILSVCLLTSSAVAREKTAYDIKFDECLKVQKEEGFRSDEHKKCMEELAAVRKQDSEERRRKYDEHIEEMKRASASRENANEKKRVALIKDMAKAGADYKKYEKQAMEKVIVIGMPQAMFDLAAYSWNCERNVTEATNRYRIQHVCYGAFSKKGELQGKYFYTEGKVVNYKGEKIYSGKVVAIQN